MPEVRKRLFVTGYCLRLGYQQGVQFLEVALYVRAIVDLLTPNSIDRFIQRQALRI